MWGIAPEPGDWVTTRRVIKATWSDHLTGSGIPVGTKGVVVGRQGGTVSMEIGGSGRVVRAPVGSLRLTRRHGGWETFHARRRRMTIVRIALACFLLFPIVQFVVLHLLHHRSTDGLVPSFAEAALLSVDEMVSMLVQNPVRAVVYFAFLAVLGRIAFKH
jgi:hypothetical protein